jgi:hypothetical protein
VILDLDVHQVGGATVTSGAPLLFYTHQIKSLLSHFYILDLDLFLFYERQRCSLRVIDSSSQPYP